MSKEQKKAFKEKWSLEGFAISGRDHVGKILDNTKISDAVESSIILGCAYFGAVAAQKIIDSPEAIAGGALAGMIGYKLATTFGGTPPVSQIAGLAILGGIGVIDIDPVKLAVDVIGGDIEKLATAAHDGACKECTDQGGTCGGTYSSRTAHYLVCALADGTKKYIKY